MEKRVEMTCINCPVGCALVVCQDENGKIEVTQNKCPRGAIYGEKELVNPTRIVTSSVRIKGNDNTVVSVKTERAISKNKIKECIDILRDISIETPINIGDVIVKNIAETGVDIIATRNAP